jgi:hypothetical protein
MRLFELCLEILKDSGRPMYPAEIGEVLKTKYARETHKDTLERVLKRAYAARVVARSWPDKCHVMYSLPEEGKH